MELKFGLKKIMPILKKKIIKNLIHAFSINEKPPAFGKSKQQVCHRCRAPVKKREYFFSCFFFQISLNEIKARRGDSQERIP